MHLSRWVRVLVICSIGLVAGTLIVSRPSVPPSSKKSVSKQASVGKREERNPRLDPSEVEKLSALPYTDWSAGSADPSKVGVVHREPGKTAAGLNLYNSRKRTEAHLVDSNGKFVHSWSAPSKGKNWHTTKLMKDGDLLVIATDRKLLRLGWDSRMKWEYRERFHHDLAMSPDGLIYALTRRAEMWRTLGLRIPIVKEYISVLTENGNFVKEINLFEVLAPLIKEERIKKIHSWAQKNRPEEGLKEKLLHDPVLWENEIPDAFHVNSIEIVDRNISGVAKKGDLLLSIRQLNLICIFRERSRELVWSWGPGQVQCQHNASLLENDNILVFDNGCQRGFSRIVEVNPRTKQIVWEYKTSPSENFFSFRRGGVQRLANGNTLITESDRGRVIEVTPEGKIVWEFLNPEVDSKKRRAIIYRMIRYPENFLNKGLAQ
jgi:hypothetical protein